jgi:hypothetical protein
MLEIRAAMALTRLLPTRPSGRRARRRLVEILDGLMEDSDTADVREARELAAG